LTLIHLYNDTIGSCELLGSFGTDLDVVNSARVSFNVEKEVLDLKDARLINYLWDNRHTSPFEHCNVKFRCVVPMFIARQHMRHRTWSYNEVSRRYTPENLDFYLPTEFRTQHTSNRQASNEATINPVVAAIKGSNLTWTTKASEALLKHTRKSTRLYNDLLDSGVCREQARMVLPQNMYCKYVASANLLNCLKFIALRDKPEAQYEIRVLAQAMGTFIQDIFPITWEAFQKGN
jgi:thymidylate synthase (FAD)